MSQKNRDEKNRWRNVTIAFRVSHEENQSINLRVKLSGLTKQDYIVRRCQEKDVVVVGNPRVYKALKEQLTFLLEELHRLEHSGDMPELMVEATELIAMTLSGMKETSNQEVSTHE